MASLPSSYASCYDIERNPVVPPPVISIVTTPLLLDTPFNVVAAVVTISIVSDPGSIIRKH
jgi:hypothetical protein